MPLVDYAALPEFPMRDGITGKWIASRERGASGVGVLSNTVQPGVAAPLHRHDYEEVILVEAGKIWVELEAPAWGAEAPFAPGKSTYLEGALPAVS